MRFGFVSGSYTAASTAIADEECINLFAENLETPTAQTPRSYLWTPGILTFATFAQGPHRGSVRCNDRMFSVSGGQLCEVDLHGTVTVRGTVQNDGNPASLVASAIQILIISGGQAYCYTLATNALVNVTGQLAGVPVKAEFVDSYFICMFKNSNKFQISQILDGATWPGQLVNEVSVFPENISSIIANHRELWILGQQHAQPYQDTGSLEVFDVIPGALIEKGCAATFGPCRLDNSVFWIDEDERGGRSAWRSSGYTPQRVSTHAVEADLATYASVSGLVSYSYQEAGHLFWVLYVPGAQWSWVFDVTSGLWHKRDKMVAGIHYAHWGWNHVYAFGKHLIGDWASGTLYELSTKYLTDNGTSIRRVRRSPTVADEMRRLFQSQLTVDFDTGLGPQPPLTDGEGNPRAPQAMLRWSDDRGKTWSNEHIANCGMAGEYRTRVIWRRLGHSRYRVYELSMTDPIPWIIVDAYLGW